MPVSIPADNHKAAGTSAAVYSFFEDGALGLVTTEASSVLLELNSLLSSSAISAWVDGRESTALTYTMPKIDETALAAAAEIDF
jgi:hypothetical protein